MNTVNRIVINWLYICLVMIFIMINIGGITRLTQSGLSMVDWKPLMGIIPPIGEEQWLDSFNQYKQYPEYQKINKFSMMTLSDYKFIFFWEYFHRIFGRIIGLTMIIPFLYFSLKGYLNKDISKKMIFSIFLVIFQGLLGWYMVKSGLVNVPHVSHFRLASHLLLAFFLIAYIYWIILSLQRNKYISNENQFYINILLFLYTIQLIYGAFIAGTKAGMLWNTYPLIEGKFIPDGLLAINPIYMNFLNNMKTFQFLHRWIALILLVYSIFIYYKFHKEFFNKNTLLIIILFMMQFYIGVMTLILKVPLFLGVLHQAVAVIILLSILKLKHSMMYK